MPSSRALPLVVAVLVAGCQQLFGGGAPAGTRRAESSPFALPPSRTIAITLVSACKAPVDVCYEEERCVTLKPLETRTVSAESDTGESFVHLRDGKGVFADHTFNRVELSDGCDDLRRHIPKKKPSPSY